MKRNGERALDVAIVGGGLAGTLLAWRLASLRPDLRLALFEAGPALGGNHTWSFHETDLPADIFAWLAPLVIRRWPEQSVRFPAHARTLKTPYCAVSSARLHEKIALLLGPRARFRVSVSDISQNAVRLSDGEEVTAAAVIDARGAVSSPHLALGYQKFVGQEIEFSAPHGLAAPIIMDATIPQEDGYRFFYVLPFTETTALIEDTRYADGDALDQAALRTAIANYCADQGWRPTRTLREEEGVLPIALAGDIDAFLADGPEGVARIGMRAALFHPLTGYSLPDAARLAWRLAAARDLSGPALARLAHDDAEETWSRRGFYRLLARMLYGAAAPAARYKVLERFYRLPQPLIERFYAGGTSLPDQLRILAGKPPVPIGRALSCVSEEGWIARARKG